jgi:N-acetylglutamate synthase-like GNAT family acetyltransferase
MDADTATKLLIKRLAPAEYEQLRNVEEGYVPDPAHSIVIMALNEKEIIGRVLLIRPFHIEGTWIDPRFRRGTVGIRMFRLLEEEAKQAGLVKIFSYAQSSEVEGYLERMKYEKIPVSVWTKCL